jgi:tripartite-type tricarboxylate transporter receptor subunit TctC
MPAGLVGILAERLQDKLGHPFVVENRAGASGNVGHRCRRKKHA